MSEVVRVDDDVDAMWRGRVLAVVDHVRSHLSGDLSLDALASVVHVSPHHFHRLFGGITGESPAAYVRRARCERAAQLMMADPDRDLTAIAYDVGYPDPSSLSRAFRRHHGIAPSAWDRQTRLGPSPRDPDVPLPVEGELVLPARVVSRPSLRLAVVRCPGLIGVDDLREDYHRLLDWATAVGIDLTTTGMVGMSWDNHATTPLDQLHYDFGLVVGDEVEVSGPVAERVLPSSSWVTVTCRGPMSTIARAWDHLYEDWFPRTSRQPRHVPAAKFFHRRPDELDWVRWELDCAIALAPSG